MTISIAVRNFCGIVRADLQVSSIALLAGQNFTGKTSTCRAIGAALSGRVIPIDEMKKGEAGMLVKTGEAEASVGVGNEEGQVKLTWPTADRVTSGKPPESSVFAVGLDTIVDMDAKARATALASYLRSEPTHEDLNAALKDAGVPPHTADKVWAKAQAEGWDAMHRTAKDYGARLKGEWQQVTGTEWGDKKAAAWAPEHWTDDLAEADLEQLGAAAYEAHKAHDEARLNVAVDTERVAHLKAEASFLPDLDKQAKSEKEAVDAATAKLAELQEQRAALPPAETGGGLPCPHCGKGVLIAKIAGGYQIGKAAEKLSAAEIKKRRDAIAVADGQIANYRDKLTIAQKRLREIEIDQGKARQAADELAAVESKGGTDAGAIEKARDAAGLAQNRLNAAKAKREADGKVVSVRQYQAITSALAPDGLRKTALARGLETFNTRLADLCRVAGWKAVTIEETLAVRLGGRPYMLLSDSEALRVRYVLAIAMAQIDGSAMLVLDRADTLDQPGRQGLVKLLGRVGIPALVAMTFSRPEEVPDLARWQMGQSFWIDKGVARPLADVVRQEAA